MAVIFADRIKETTTTTGTGDITLAGAVQGFRTFASALTTGDTCYYCIDDDAGNWEIGLGTFDTVLERTTVHTSSNAGSAVNFGAGTKYVFITVSAACWNDWVSGLAGMANLPDNLVFEYEVTGSAVTTIPATGLDLNADGVYEIMLSLVTTSETDYAVYMFVNNDTTTTNYEQREIWSGSTSTGTSSYSSPTLSWSTISGVINTASAILSLADSHAVWNATDNRIVSGGTELVLYFTYKTTTDTNITRLDFTSSLASGIGVGSKVKIFKKEW